MNAVKNLSIRLQAVGGDKVCQEFKSLGTDGQKAFRQITQVITPANDNLKALSDTAKTFNGVLKQAAGLVGAYAGLRGLTSTFKNIFNINNEFESLSGSLKGRKKLLLLLKSSHWTRRISWKKSLRRLFG